MCSYLVRKVDDPELLTKVRAPTQGQQHDERPSADQTVEQRSVLTHRLHEGVASERRIRWVGSLTHLHSSKLLINLRSFRQFSKCMIMWNMSKFLFFIPAISHSVNSGFVLGKCWKFL